MRAIAQSGGRCQAGRRMRNPLFLYECHQVACQGRYPSVVAAGMIPLLFRIDASAILLSIESHGLGRLDSILPADSIVIVQKLYAVMLAQLFAHFTNHLVVLVTGIKKAGRERIVAGFRCVFCRLFEARLVAVSTAIGWF